MSSMGWMVALPSSFPSICSVVLLRMMNCISVARPSRLDLLATARGLDRVVRSDAAHMGTSPDSQVGYLGMMLHGTSGGTIMLWVSQVAKLTTCHAQDILCAARRGTRSATMPVGRSSPIGDGSRRRDGASAIKDFHMTTHTYQHRVHIYRYIWSTGHLVLQTFTEPWLAWLRISCILLA
ncbi:hypothetical protein V8F33_007116 [Rhypophila sp. PSN 637]